MRWVLPALLGTLLAAAVIPGVCAQEQDVQQAANQLVADHLRSVNARSKKQFYPADKWDLSDLADYEAQGQVSGTIRIGKAKYLRLSRVMGQWEAEFRKYHPDVVFEHSNYNLVTGLVDIVQQRGFTFGEWQQVQLEHGRYPLEIEMPTGCSNRETGWTGSIRMLRRVRAEVPRGRGSGDRAQDRGGGHFGERVYRARNCASEPCERWRTPVLFIGADDFRRLVRALPPLSEHFDQHVSHTFRPAGACQHPVPARAPAAGARPRILGGHAQARVEEKLPSRHRPGMTRAEVSLGSQN